MRLDRCGCCEGTHRITPVDVSNRPGLTRLAYRVGTHVSFLETMKARLSSMTLEIPDPANVQQPSAVSPLRSLTTRQENDPSIALLDAWATTADVITFYQERIANEGYLRTAEERRSLVELARLVGYVPRPGVASSVYLAFILQKTTPPPAPPLPGPPSLTVPQGMPGSAGPPPAGGDEDVDIPIPAGTQAQSVPGPGELPQTFETDAPLVGRVRWNNLKPRLSRPASIKTISGGGFTLAGTTSYLSPNDPLVVISAGKPELLRVTKVGLRPAVLAWEGQTVVEAEDWLAPSSSQPAPARSAAVESPHQVLRDVLPALQKEPSSPPPTPLDLDRSVGQSFGRDSDLGPRLLTALHPELRKVLYAAWSTSTLSDPPDLSVNALRVKASVFGHNAPSRDTEEFSVSLSLATLSEVRGHGLIVSGPGSKPNQAKLAVTIGARTRRKTIDLTPGEQSIPFPAAGETLVVTISQSGTSTAETSILFSRRRFVVTIRVDITSSTPSFEVNAVGSDPTDVVLGVVTGKGAGLVVSGTLSKPFTVNEDPRVIHLDASYPKILPGSLVVVDVPLPGGRQVLIATAESVKDVSRAEYGLSGASTEITLGGDGTLVTPDGASEPITLGPRSGWIDPSQSDFSVIRGTTVYALSEELTLAEEAIDPEEEPVAGDGIELDEVYGGLQSGRWVIVAGERVDVGVAGVMAAEVAMLAGVEQLGSNLPGDRVHTFLRLANPLAYGYRRDSVTIHGNVAEATHGATRTEVLGGGDSSVPISASNCTKHH